MASTILFLVLSLGAIGLGIPIRKHGTEDSCEAELRINREPYQCSGEFAVRFDCETGTLNLTHTNISQFCNSIYLFWSSPGGNLTIDIETPFTKTKESYTIELSNGRMLGAISHVYQLIDGKEIEVTIKNDNFVLKSDSNYQVILVLQGPPKLVYFGVFIVYNVTKS